MKTDSIYALVGLIVISIVSMGLFFLLSYFLQLAYNGSIAKLFEGAREEDNYWTFVVLSIFIILICMLTCKTDYTLLMNNS